MNHYQHRTHRVGGPTPPTPWIRIRDSQKLVDPWQVVERRRSGLLRYARARGAVALPVLYATREHRVYVRLPEYNDACNFVDRADVALDVDATSVGRVLIVRVAGIGLLVPETALPPRVGNELETWSDDLPTRVMVLVPESVHRIPVSDDVRYPPLPHVGAQLPGTFVES